MLLAPRAHFTLIGSGTADFFERPRRKNYRNQATVLHDFHAAESRDIFQEAAEVVFRVACGYGLCHLAILAKIWTRTTHHCQLLGRSSVEALDSSCRADEA